MFAPVAIVLAEAYGIRDREQLMEIAQGALLHDLGKCFVPAKLLNKVTPLTQGGAGLDSPAPRGGFEELCMRPDLSWGQLMMVYQHHERYDGRGYPRPGRQGDPRMGRFVPWSTCTTR